MNKSVVFTSHRLPILYFSSLARAGIRHGSWAFQDMTKRERLETGLLGGKFELDRVYYLAFVLHRSEGREASWAITNVMKRDVGKWKRSVITGNMKRNRDYIQKTFSVVLIAWNLHWSLHKPPVHFVFWNMLHAVSSSPLHNIFTWIVLL